MTLAAMIDHIQYVVHQQGRTTAVLITPELWRHIVDTLEEMEDRALVPSLCERLALAPETAGALRWDDAAGQWQ
ncbi:MAG: hypothetical protein M9936_18705 [Caldilinea sp.]|nr:hypothetical protein [Caldilinea sp.]MCB0051201.1 hypothetical protein [Caldilinea sp.]MCB0148277.1 hypothetical protein [Caldilineaceae bacterium]MCO5211728.1 hypothetical protein [Caldilinea sp.]